jgi:hypothetical protein
LLKTILFFINVTLFWDGESSLQFDVDDAIGLVERVRVAGEVRLSEVFIDLTKLSGVIRSYSSVGVVSSVKSLI